MLVFLGKLCLAFLLILGAAEAVRLLLNALLHTKKSGRVVFVLAFHGHDEEAEFALRGAVQKLKWMGGRDFKQVLCLDCGMDEETRQVCEKMAEEYACISIRTPGEVAEE